MSATLIVDNIDSFVYNIVQYVGQLKGNPIVVENTMSIEAVGKIIAENSVDHIIISPGPKTPKEAGVSNDILKEYHRNIPILGVCLGHQCIGSAFGANIRNAKILMHGKTSMIQHYGNSLFEGLANPFEATRYHSLVVDPNGMPECLEVIATSMDDHELMGVKHRKYPVFGVQFHPESILSKDGIRIISNFLEIKGVL